MRVIIDVDSKDKTKLIAAIAQTIAVIVESPHLDGSGRRMGDDEIYFAFSITDKDMWSPTPRG